VRPEIVELLEGSPEPPLRSKEARLAWGASSVLAAVRSALQKLRTMTIDPLTRERISSKLTEALDLLKRGEAGEARIKAEEALAWLEVGW
jgi:hypothetical protein